MKMRINPFGLVLGKHKAICNLNMQLNPWFGGLFPSWRKEREVSVPFLKLKRESSSPAFYQIVTPS